MMDDDDGDDDNDDICTFIWRLMFFFAIYAVSLHDTRTLAGTSIHSWASRFVANHDRILAQLLLVSLKYLIICVLISALIMSTKYIFLLLLPLCIAQRATIQKYGAVAAQSLLKGSARIGKRKNYYNYFLKEGTKKTAYREFLDAVDPDSVIKREINYSVTYEGRAGDRILYYTPYDHREKNMPTISVFDPKRVSTRDSGAWTDKIIYRDIDIEWLTRSRTRLKKNFYQSQLKWTRNFNCS